MLPVWSVPAVAEPRAREPAHVHGTDSCNRTFIAVAVGGVECKPRCRGAGRSSSTWSLWLFVIRQGQDHTTFAHPFFRTSDGVNLATTANAVWEALARGDFTVNEQPHDILQTISSSENEALGQCEEYRSEIRQPNAVTAIDFFPVLYVSVEGKDA